jgi:nucleotide-binding universal stress UspA family protein
MKRIVAVFDGLKYSESTEKYAIHLAKESSAHLVAAFLEDSSYHSYKIYELVHEDGVLSTKQRKLNKKDEKTRAAAVARLETACVSEGLNVTIHKSRQVAIQELRELSSYSDLIIIDKTDNFSHHPEEPPTSFMKEFLAEAACPVLVVPHVYQPVNKIVLLFDGHLSSIHAIKMFSYTLAALKDCPARILTVKKPGESGRIPDNRLMTAFVKDHYPAATFTVLKGSAEREIYNYLKDLPNLLVITGAYKRSRLSRWARRSMADMLMKKLDIPLYIAHQES